MLKLRAPLLLLLLGCTAHSAEKKPLAFGIAQPYGEEHAKKARELIAPYLKAELGGPVTVVVYSSYEALAEALASSAVDLAWITPLAFVRASQKNARVEALAKAMRPGDRSVLYRSVLIVKKDSPFTRLDELKGKRVAWVSKLSASGYLFPRELLRQSGTNPDAFFGAEVFAGDHLSVCKALREGKADVGATYASGTEFGVQPRADGCSDSPPIDDFRVIAQSGSLPNDVIAASSEFPPDRVSEVLEALGGMSSAEAGKKLLKEGFRAAGWAVAVESDFAPVLELLGVKNGRTRVAPGPGARGKK